MYYVTESRGIIKKKIAFGVCPHNSYDVPYIVGKPIVHKPRLVYRVTCHYHLKHLYSIVVVFMLYCVISFYFFYASK